jgi:hypothetical protein
MTYAELRAAIGTGTGIYVLPGDPCMAFPVNIIDARTRFGTLDLLIHPAGLPKNGQRWVEASKVTILPETHHNYAPKTNPFKEISA